MNKIISTLLICLLLQPSYASFLTEDEEIEAEIEEVDIEAEIEEVDIEAEIEEVEENYKDEEKNKSDNWYMYIKKDIDRCGPVSALVTLATMGYVMYKSMNEAPYYFPDEVDARLEQARRYGADVVYARR